MAGQGTEVGVEVGVGVVGCGGMGSWHAANVARQPGLRVVAVADVVPAAAERLGAELGARVIDGDALVAADEVDAVVVASSDESHAHYACATLALGKPCLLEKPLGDTIAQADQILDAELAAGRRLIRLGFMRELDPAHAQVAAALAELGPVTSIRGMHRNVDQVTRPVEILLSQSLIHDVHTVRWLSGSEIDAVTTHLVERTDGFRDILLVCRLASGAVAVLQFEDQGFAYEVHVEVTAEGGMAATLPHPRAVERRAGREGLAVGADWFARFEDAYRLEIEEWAMTLADGVPRGPSTWDGYAAQLVIDAATRSLASGTEEAVALRSKPALYG